VGKMKLNIKTGGWLTPFWGNAHQYCTVYCHILVDFVSLKNYVLGFNNQAFVTYDMLNGRTPEQLERLKADLIEIAKEGLNDHVMEKLKKPRIGIPGKRGAFRVVSWRNVE